MINDMIEMGDGCRIAYRFDGPEDAPVLMLSNSLGTAMEMWDLQMASFAKNFRVLRYDSRGHGLSDAPTGAYSIDRLGRDVVKLLDTLNIARVTFCGLSKGGMIGQWLGWRAPERIERLILANTSAYMGPPEGWDARIAAVMAQGMEAMVGPVIQRWFTPDFVTSAPDLVERLRAMLLATPAHGYAGCCAAIRDMDQRAVLRLIDRPTLVIGGVNDGATPIEHAESIAAAINGAQLDCLEAAHLSNVEASAAFEFAVSNFLSSR